MTSSKVHILYVAEYSTGGSVESLLCLVGGLDKRKYAATVLFFSMPEEATCRRFESAGATIHSLYPYSSRKGQPKELRKLSMQARIRGLFGSRIEKHYESLKFMLHFIRFRRTTYKAIRQKILDVKPDIVHLNNGVASDTPGILAARRCQVRAVCHVRTLGRLTRPSIWASRSVAKFICISHAVRKRAVSQGVDDRHCIVVPNAVDLTRFNTNTETIDIRTEFDWNHADNVLTLAGRVVAWKGQEYFIRAIAEVRKTNTTVRGLIVGAGEDTTKGRGYVAGLQQLINDLDQTESVILAGHRTDIPEIMRSSDVVVCPSSEPEPFGRVIIESMGVGTPVIATNAGGAPDIIDDGVNGLLVPTKDVEALAAAMHRLCNDEALIDQIRSAGLADAQRLYSVNKHVDIICDVYQKILA